MYLFSGMNGTVTWMVVQTLMISTLPGGILFSGRNGGSMPECALRQVHHHIPSTYDNLMEDLDDDRNSEKDRSKTIKTPVHITIEDTGEPAVPSITYSDGTKTKVAQAALRNYCTAHIHMPHSYSMLCCLINVY
jgi:hypothetical protein